MKKFFLLALSASAILSTYAQTNSLSVYKAIRKDKNLMAIPVTKTLPANSIKRGAKTTTATIATENFSSGTDTTMPTGWTTGIIDGPGAWHWSQTASSSPASMGLMNSTTAANGWMIFDGDSLQSDCSCAVSAWLQSPAYNCSGHSTVRLNFEEYFGHVDDTSEVWVSTSPTFSTYTTYPLSSHNGMVFNSTTPNTALKHIDISSSAAGHPAVYIRFVFRGNDFFDLSWMVDDMTITELEPHDAGFSAPFLLAQDASAFNGTVRYTPLSCVDSISPGALLSNYGFNPETNVPCSLNIYRGGTSVYSHSNTYGALPYAATDSIHWFPKYKPNDTGNYACAYNSSLPSDADIPNNRDTLKYYISDTTWMQNDTAIATNYFLNLATFGPFHSSTMLGVRFDVPSGATGDTVTGFGVAFSPISKPPNPGNKVSIQLYSRKQTDTAWAYVATSVARAITTADFSTFTNTKWADFRIDTGTSGGVAPFVLHPGTSYAAMIQMNHVTTDLLVFAADQSRIPGVSHSIMLSDTSANNGAHSFRQRANDTFFSNFVPFLRMYLGNAPVDKTAVSEISNNSAVPDAYPDPANTYITVPVYSDQTEVIKTTLSNMAGQVVRTQEIHCNAGKATKATFATADLPAGTYIYNVIGSNQKRTGRITITH